VRPDSSRSCSSIARRRACPVDGLTRPGEAARRTPTSICSSTTFVSRSSRRSARRCSSRPSPAAIYRAHPRPPHRHAPAAERHAPVLMVVPDATRPASWRPLWSTPWRRFISLAPSALRARALNAEPQTCDGVARVATLIGGSRHAFRALRHKPGFRVCGSEGLAEWLPYVEPYSEFSSVCQPSKRRRSRSSAPGFPREVGYPCDER
jgi:hypothetical protein